MPVVYAVLCHQSPPLVADLVRALHHPEQPIILHADAKAPPPLHAALRHLSALLPNVHVADSVLCSWGGWSLVEASLRMIGQALALPTPWRHFCLLSEHHVPLQSPVTIAASLPDGVSFADALSPPAMDAYQRRDLRHRFARYWRELPGVGMFATGKRALAPAQIDVLRLGSQWVVLARDACERLWAARDDAELWHIFRESLVPDETALLSVLRGTQVGAGLNIKRSSMTFVAWPHLGGSADSGFDDDSVRNARARGYLFIRKRPARLPPFAAALLCRFPNRPNLPPFATIKVPSADHRVAGVADALRARLAGVVVGAAPPGSGPTCCLEFAVPGQAPALSLHLLSHDLAAFKLLLAWRRPFDGPIAPISLGGHEASIIGARLPGLTLAREVHLFDIPDHGFIGGNADDLAPHIATALTVARALSPLVATQAG